MEKLKTNSGISVYLFKIDICDTGHITNTYLIVDEKTNESVLIDPADKIEQVERFLKNEKIRLKACIVTHAHADHILALEKIIKKYKNIKVFVHELDIPALNNKILNEQDILGVEVPQIEISKIERIKRKRHIKVGSINLETIHTPGHTQGSISLFESTSNSLFTGDTIFENTYGRTDLKLGNSKDMKKSLDILFDRFFEIDTYSGHGEPFILENVKKKIRLIYSFKK